MEPLRLGLVGTGYWARIQAEAALQVPEIELVGVWGRRSESAEEFSTEYGIPAVEDVNELIAQSEAVQFAVPPTIQVELAPLAAQAGKHLMLEKPLAPDLASAERLVEAVEAAGVVTQLMLIRRFHPAVQEFFDSLRELGELDGVTSNFLSGGILKLGGVSPWRVADGALYDLGPHALDLVEQAGGRITALSAVRTAGDAIAVSSRHGDHIVSSLMMTGLIPDARTQNLVAFSQQGSKTLDLAVAERPESLANAYREFALAIRTGSPVRADVHRGLEIQRLIDAIERSLASRREVEV